MEQTVTGRLVGGLRGLVVGTVVFFIASNLLEAKRSFVSQALESTHDNVVAFLEDVLG